MFLNLSLLKVCGQNKTVHHLFTHFSPKQRSGTESLAGAQKNEKQTTIQTICKTFPQPLSISSEHDCSNLSARLISENHTHQLYMHPCLLFPSLLNTNLASTQIKQKSPNSQKYSFERSENGNKKQRSNDKSKHQKFQHLKKGKHKNLLQKLVNV